MKLVDVENGGLIIRWMWLPFWIATNTSLIAELDDRLRDCALLNSATTDDADLDALNLVVVKHLAKRHPLKGIYSFLTTGYGHLQMD
jgi:hypothetical protein